MTRLLTYLTALLVFAFRLVRPERGYRCAGDLVRFEMDEWINNVERQITHG